MAGMTPSEILYQKEHIQDNRNSDVIGVGVTMAILATAVVTLRFLCRKQMKVVISYDDYLMLAALVFALSLCFLLIYGVHFGSGQHLLAIGTKKLQEFLKLEYAYQIIYAFTLTLVRLSILMFYRRLFPRGSTPARWRACLYAVTFLVFGFFISSLASAVFICTPISFFWIRSGSGYCVNIPLLLYFSAALTVVADISILLLPMPIVWNLQMKRSKKIGVMGIFLLGGFACVASIVRISCIPQIVVTDPTWTQVNLEIWSFIEPCIGIVSACLPIIAPSLRSKFGSVSGTWWFGRSKRSGRSNSYAVNSSDGRNISGPLPMKPVVSATIHSRSTQNDEEMAVPLRHIRSQR